MRKIFNKLNERLARVFKSCLKLLRPLRGHPLAIPIVVFLGLCLITSIGLLALNHGTPKFKPISSYIVIISHDHIREAVPTNEATVGSLIKKLKIEVGPNDRVEPSLKTPIKQDNLRINIYRSMPVQIVVDGRSQLVQSSATTPRSIARQAGVAVYPEDKVRLNTDDNFIDSYSLGKQVVVTSAKPVNLNLYGTPTVVRTYVETVGELLKQKNIKLGKGDSVQPAPATLLLANSQVYIIHSGTKLITETQTIPAPTQTIHDDSLSFGTSAVRQQGTPGQQVVTYQINTENGVETGRTQIQSVITVQPVTGIVAQGQAVSIPADKQAVMAQAGIAPDDYKYVDYIASREGSWCPTKIQGTHTCPGYMNPGDVPAYNGYGVFQATPGRKMASAGSDWATNVVTQIRWATGYAVGRYGSWEGAYNRWVNTHNW
ncbi:MAG: ubiquitin-like domain-containing protein [Candidatus Saccharimonadales bacterium]